MTKKITVLLVDDHGLVRRGFRRMLEDEPDMAVVGEASDGEEAISFIQKADNDRKAPGPDLLLLDMHLPKYNGEEILACLRSTELYAQIPVVVMTSSDAPADHDALRGDRVDDRAQPLGQVAGLPLDRLPQVVAVEELAGAAEPAQDGDVDVGAGVVSGTYQLGLM